MTIVINAVKSGLWHDPTVWSVGRVPMLGDEVHANGFNIKIASNIIATEITTAAKNGGGAGGEFQAAANNLVITADIVAGATTCLNLSAISPYSAKIIGNVYGSTNPATPAWVAGVYAASDLLERSVTYQPTATVNNCYARLVEKSNDTQSATLAILIDD